MNTVLRLICIESFSNDEGESSENLTTEMNSRFFKFNFVAFQFNSAQNAKCRWFSLELNSSAPQPTSEREENTEKNPKSCVHVLHKKLH